MSCRLAPHTAWLLTKIELSGPPVEGDPSARRAPEGGVENRTAQVDYFTEIHGIINSVYRGQRNFSTLSQHPRVLSVGRPAFSHMQEGVFT
jgi:hypothetical protein